MQKFSYIFYFPFEAELRFELQPVQINLRKFSKNSSTSLLSPKTQICKNIQFHSTKIHGINQNPNLSQIIFLILPLICSVINSQLIPGNFWVSNGHIHVLPLSRKAAFDLCPVEMPMSPYEWHDSSRLASMPLDARHVSFHLFCPPLLAGHGRLSPFR